MDPGTITKLDDLFGLLVIRKVYRLYDAEADVVLVLNEVYFLLVIHHVKALHNLSLHVVAEVDAVWLKSNYLTSRQREDILLDQSVSQSGI